MEMVEVEIETVSTTRKNIIIYSLFVSDVCHFAICIKHKLME